MHQSENLYDWLGSGIYFWENDPVRAYEFARDVKQCKEPFVVGAVIDLGYCLDLTCRENIETLRFAWEQLALPNFQRGGLRTNRPGRHGETGELMLRFLDRYVIELLHTYNKDNGLEQFDSVRAGFWEGHEIYPTAGFMEKSHLQLCIRNNDCILGTFLPDGYQL